MDRRGIRSGASGVRRRFPRVLMAAVFALTALAGVTSTASAADPGTYQNPLKPTGTARNPVPGNGIVETCADPTVIYGRGAYAGYWYMYCTTDPLNDDDRNASGGFNFRMIPQFRSRDLVNWKYMGDAFHARPAYARPDAGLWAPEIQYFNGKYYLYYTVTDTTFEGGGSAIGVATSNSPLGPWTHSNEPVVEPHEPDCCPGARRWVFDPEVAWEPGTNVRYIFYGSYFGGISARKLTPNGLDSQQIPNPFGKEWNVTAANKYEGANLYRKNGYWWLFVSATNCCNGPLTGYSVFVGRSRTLLGPYVDQDGVSLLEQEPAEDPTDARVGGTVALSMNGNMGVGPGHNTTFTAFDGQPWMIYHAVNRFDACMEGTSCFTKRPALLDPVDWVRHKDGDKWPSVRGGQWASAPGKDRAAPAAQPGQVDNYNAVSPWHSYPGQYKSAYSDEFNGSLGAAWSWVRPPATETYGVSNGRFRFDVQEADLHMDNNTASILLRNAPAGNYVVETKVNLNWPNEGCCFNYSQAGLIAYNSDDRYNRLTVNSIWNTRQTEWAKEVPSGAAPEPNRYGNTVVGPTGDWTYLRLIKTTHHGKDYLQAYTRREGAGNSWYRGGTWVQPAGSITKIGLISLGEDACCGPNQEWTAQFEYFRVYDLVLQPPQPLSTYTYDPVR